MDQTTRFPASVDVILAHLKNTQWWPPDIMRRHQFDRIKPLVGHAYDSVPWYRERFGKLGAGPEDLVRDDCWNMIPLLTRFDIQAAGQLLHSTKIPASHGRTSPKWTSGSTAAPVMVLKTELTDRFWIANAIRQYQWRQCDWSDKLAVIRNVPEGEADPPHGTELDTWGPATAGRIATGPCVVLDVRSTMSQQADWLVREQPAYLQTYPSTLYELAREVLETDRRVDSLRQIHTFGEALEPKVREACRRAWGVEILDAYSSNEVGHIASQCEQCDGYHVYAEHLLVEVLDDDGRTCGPGEIGRIVVTDLFNFAMPLLRYDIGDYAEVGEPCSCGRNLPTLRRVLGRQRNMFVLPNGEKHWPAFDEEVLNAFEGQLPVRQFQMIQTDRYEICANLVAVRRLTEEEETRIRAILARWFSEQLNIRFRYVEHIPRGPTGKYEDYRCDIASDG